MLGSSCLLEADFCHAMERDELEKVGDMRWNSGEAERLVCRGGPAPAPWAALACLCIRGCRVLSETILVFCDSYKKTAPGPGETAPQTAHEKPGNMTAPETP